MENQFRGSGTYVASEELLKVTNIAIALQKPLLVKGEPGTGKTVLAQAIANALQKRLLIWNIKSTTKAQDGLYVYDVVQRLYDSQMGVGDIEKVEKYVKLGKLGEAFSSDEQVILLIDEIDKVAGRSNGGHGPDVSREGVQRDILPIVEGCTVNTKYGAVRTDYMLFIAAGAFHVAKVTDLIPELQGRFPVHVQLKSLTQEDFKAILTQPENALTRQYEALLAVDKVFLSFEDSAIDAIASAAYVLNETKEDIGARRLHAVFEKLLEDISFNAGGDDMPNVYLNINGDYVIEHLGQDDVTMDLKRYIL